MTDGAMGGGSMTDRAMGGGSGGGGSTGRSSYLLERAWISGEVVDDVLVEIEDGRFTSVTPATSVSEGRQNSRLGAETSAGKREFHRLTGEPPPGSSPAFTPTHLSGLTIPGLANCHSHAFHRALRGRTQRGSSTFWTWREQMYAVAVRLDPDSYYRLARATYAEMAAAGIATVGEFHYLHHQPDGTPYDDPNAMGRALVAAASDVGVRIALLDTVYLSSGFGAPVEAAQLRYSDRSAARWAARTAQLRGSDTTVIGAAIHSVRAVPDDQLAAIVEAAAGKPLHVHLSEQVAENDACIAAYGATPTQLLADHGVLGPLTTVVHATHLTADDIRHLGSTRTRSCFCPTTERDLGDGIGPSRALHDAGSRLTLGSDSHAVIDLFEEMRAVELDERLARQSRGHWTAAELLSAATVDGHASLGFPDAGQIAVGARADLVTIATDHPSTAGTGADEHTAVFAATAADVNHVVVDGRVLDVDRLRVGRDLAAAIGTLLP